MYAKIFARIETRMKHMFFFYLRIADVMELSLLQVWHVLAL